MSEWIGQLPAWMLLLVVLFWVFLDKILPRINRKGRTSEPPAQQATQQTQHQTAPAYTGPSAEELHKERSMIFSSFDRFEEMMERIFSSNQEQIRLLREIASGLEQDRRTTATLVEVIHELRPIIRSVSMMQEQLLRRLEDTGRFRVDVPPTRGG